MQVLITGAAGGLGRAMAIECARHGYDLFLTDCNAAGLARIKAGLERKYGAAVAAQACDLTDSGSVDALLQAIDARSLRFDLLLSIAGIDVEGGFLCRAREQLVGIVTLNVTATLRITHAILERRRETSRFTAVLVSSLASMFPMPLKATYAASKRFLLDFATALRQELKEQNANVLVLCPGGMATNAEAAAAISAQGFWGDVTTNPLERVARRTLDRALRGRSVYVPGLINRALCLPVRLLVPWRRARPPSVLSAAAVRRARGGRGVLRGAGASARPPPCRACRQNIMCSTKLSAK